MIRRRIGIIFSCCFFLFVHPLIADDKIDYFENHIRPILAEHCYSCHGPEKSKGNIRLDLPSDLQKGLDSGPLFVPGKPKQSRLMELLSHSADIKMPPKKKLSDEQIDKVQNWIEQGGHLPKDKTVVSESWKNHWAFQPVKASSTKPLTETINQLVEKRLRTQSFASAAPADRRTLLRRIKFDLVGLPPSFEEMHNFVNDPAGNDEVMSKWIDKVLVSPQFGERWARHWLDLARYADNKGYIGVGVDRTYPFAWTYRDWVVNAFNQDMPYDQFLSYQIAADQLIRKDNPQDLAAMGFMTVGRRFINNPHDIIDDRIDVTMRSMMGLTVQCARCHDHKYDPVSIKDYYSLYGVFNSSTEPDLEEMPLLGMSPPPEASAAFNQELVKLKNELTKWDKDHEQNKKDKPILFFEQRKPLENKIRRLHADHPGAPPRGMILLDKPQPVEPVVFVRGNPGNRGPKIPRQFLPFLTNQQVEPFKQGSGRVELAKAITSPDNPLTARVWVNRVWEHLVGKPLVATPSDFGLRSEPPTHPEVLDELAASLVRNKWSTRKLIKSIMMSQVYRQSSDHAESWKKDPDNRWLARMNRKRLEWEPMRDSLLLVSGQLDSTLGGPSVDIFKQGNRRRSLYAFIDRQNLPGLFRTFDVAIPDTHSPMRFTTTVPQQTLFFMNSVFLADQVKAFLQQNAIQNITDPTERIHRCYQLIFARDAREHEFALARDYLGNKPDPNAWKQWVHALLMTNEFIFVD
ncbi:MAG: PSD1 domain-containing protein [Planctomycetia bacterium]|nr:PSD1 domain-containing protein [Planctomycetia bacterium]